MLICKRIKQEHTPNQNKVKEKSKMLKFKAVHKYTKMVRHIEGVNVWEAARNSNTDLKLWEIVEIIED